MRSRHFITKPSLLDLLLFQQIEPAFPLDNGNLLNADIDVIKRELLLYGFW